MDSLTLGITIFFLSIIIFSVIFYFKFSDDIWFQGIWAIIGFTTFIFLAGLTYSTTNLSMDNAIDKDIVVIDDMDLDNLNFVGQESYSVGTVIFLFPFENIGTKKESNFIDTDFCFYYNNTDNNPNVVRVVNNIVPISDYVYLENNTFGSECIHINSSYVKRNAMLGLECEDCGGANPLSMPEARTSFPVKEVHINGQTPTNYDLEVQDKSHVFWIETRSLPKKQINEWFVLYLLVLGLETLGLFLRGIIKSILISKKIMLEEN